MAKYLIESPHTNKGCLEALDDMLVNDPKLLILRLNGILKSFLKMSSLLL